MFSSENPISQDQLLPDWTNHCEIHTHSQTRRELQIVFGSLFGFKTTCHVRVNCGVHQIQKIALSFRNRLFEAKKRTSFTNVWLREIDIFEFQ